VKENGADERFWNCFPSSFTALAPACCAGFAGLPQSLLAGYEEYENVWKPSKVEIIK